MVGDLTLSTFIWWLIEGDQRMWLRCIRIHGERYSQPKRLKEEVKTFYNNKLNETSRINIRLDDIELFPIFLQNNMILTNIFIWKKLKILCEIVRVVKWKHNE